MEDQGRHLIQAKKLLQGMLCGVLAVMPFGSLSAIDPDGRASLVQQTPSCSDFDVTLPGKEAPAFRVLLPEHISWDEDEKLSGLHTFPGQWVETTDHLSGAFVCDGSFEISVIIDPKETEILIEMEIRNLTRGTCQDLRANICASVNHLPGEPGWSNRDFVPDSVPLNRDLQGRYWYEEATPQSLKAWTGASWVLMHAFPDRSNANTVDRYFFKAGELDNAYACAVESRDGKKLFYQAWNAPCLYWSPFPGNACTHLLPRVASSLEPGRTARVKGMVGVFSGNRSELAQQIRSELLVSME